MKPNLKANPFYRAIALGLSNLSLSMVLTIIPLGIEQAHALTVTWDGGVGGTGTDLGAAVNWSNDLTPSPATPDTIQWNGTVAGNLSLGYSGTPSLAGAAGNGGLNFDITSAQTGSLNIDSGTNTTALRLNNITIASGAGAFSLGNGLNTFGLTLGGGASTQTWTNNSSNTATIGSDVVWGLGGGGAHTLAVGGSGNWLFNNAMVQGTGVLSVTKSGAGTVTQAGANTYTGTTTVKAGTLNLTGSINSGTTSGIIVGDTAATGAILKIGGNVTALNLAVGTNATAAGAVYQTTGTVSFGQAASTNNFQLGAVASGFGYYRLSGGTLAMNEAGVGGALASTKGVMDVSGGTVNDAGWLAVARGSGSSGVLNVTGGSVNVTSANGSVLSLNTQNFSTAASGTAVVNLANGSITGGSRSANGGGLDLMGASNAANLSVFNLLSGGTLTINQVYASGASGNALLTFNGGTLKATATNFGTSFMTSANVDGVYVHGGGGTIDNNGTGISISNAFLAPTGSGVQNNITVSGGGTGYTGAPMVTFTGGGGVGATGYATIDSSTGAITGIVVTNPGTGYTSAPTIAVSGGGGSGATFSTPTFAANTSGGMTFQGSGITTLSGASTYTGATAVNGSGTLLVNGSLASGSAVTVASTATLGGGVGGTAGTINGAVTSGGTIAPGGISAVGTLAFGGGLTLTGGFINLNLSGTSNATGGTTNDLINVTGNLAANGLVLISPTFSSTPAANTSYQFATFTGTLANPSNLVAASRSVSIDTSVANQVSLTYTGASTAALNWNSTSSGSWDVLTSQNWLNGATQDYYYQGDSVTFNDTSGVQTAITINNLVSPTSTTINSNTNNFTFSGTSGIAGTGSLSKSGASSLTINTTNVFSGGTAMSGGTLNINNASAIGSGTLTITGGTIDNTTASAITLSTNNAQAWNGDFAFGGTRALNLGTGAVTMSSDRILTVNGTTEALTVGGVISGTGFGLTKNGTGTLTLGGINTFSGNVTIGNGTLTAGTGIAGNLGTSIASNLGDIGTAVSRNITINSGGTLSLTGGNVLGTGASTGTLAGVTLVVNQGGVFQSGLNGSGAGWWNKIGAVNLNGGTINIGSGANTTSFQGLALIGTVTVGGSSASTIGTLSLSNNTSNGVHLGQNTATGQMITFDVADVTGSSASDLNVSTRLLNTSANSIASGLIKTGAGTMTLSGASSYSGDTTINGGTLVANLVNNITSVTTSALGNPQVARNITVNNGGTLNFAQGDTFGSATTNVVSTLAINAGGVVTNTAGNFTTLGPVVMNGGTLTTAGGAVAGYQSFSLSSSVTVGVASTTASTISVTGGGNAFNGIHLGTNTTFNVADATGNTGSDLDVSAPLIDRNLSLTGAGGLTKSGAGTMTLSAVNTYSGNTAISAGTLALSGSGTIANSPVITVNSGATLDVSGVTTGPWNLGATQVLAGSGSVTGATNIQGIQRPGTAGTVGTQTFSSTLNYDTGSIFEWDLSAASTTDPGVVADAATGTYDQVVSAGAITGGAAIFKLVLTGNTFADAFWDTDKSWTNIFTGAGTPAALSAIFSSFSATGGLDSAGFVSGRGQFTFNGSNSTLNWSAVPEPTSALAGVLLAAGMLRRRRVA